MSRTADYTIQGFLYQFNKTALAILRSQEENIITVEGTVEDIEVATATSLLAIQCKYHEASASFTPSAIYKPLLQMLKHFYENQTSNVHYVLFAHFPGADVTPPSIDKAILKAALNSKDQGLASLIKAIPTEINLDEFLNRFTMEFGASYDKITKQVGIALKANGIPKDTVETIAYPNAIHMIANLSVKHDVADRQITKKKFLSDLRAIRTTAISQWTLALKTRKKILGTRRKQLKTNLDNNARLRYFIINPSCIEDYDAEIVLFISDYLDKYHFKPAHICTPILCLNAERNEIDDIQRRLFSKGILTTDGYVGGQFQYSRFFRDPLTPKASGSKAESEFRLRILSWNDHGTLLNTRKCDDLYIIGKIDSDVLDTVDINVERISGATFKEIKFILGLSDIYE